MDDVERDELVRKLFALLMMKLEDGAGRVAEGQGEGVNPCARVELANTLMSAGHGIALLAEAVIAIVLVN